jgi:hypothetical protein
MTIAINERSLDKLGTTTRRIEIDPARLIYLRAACC